MVVAVVSAAEVEVKVEAAVAEEGLVHVAEIAVAVDCLPQQTTLADVGALVVALAHVAVWCVTFHLVHGRIGSEIVGQIALSCDSPWHVLADPSIVHSLIICCKFPSIM